ncbi:MAG: fasciclin domain-containing protein, partial [Planctomycetota bacterium]
MKTTLIAPTAKALQTPRMAELMKPGNEEVLNNLLRRHFVFGELKEEYFGEGNGYMTMYLPPKAGPYEYEGVKATKDDQGGLLLDGFPVVKVINAKNGKIYVIDALLSIKNPPKAAPESEQDADQKVE